MKNSIRSSRRLLSTVIGGLMGLASMGAHATENLFANPGFVSSLWGWNVNVVNPNEDSIRWVAQGGDGMDSSAKFFTDGLTNPSWHMQLAQRKTVKAGDVYTLRFDVATTGQNEREVTLYVQQDGGGWNLYQEQTCSVPAVGVAHCQLVGTTPYSENVNFGIKGADNLWDFTVDNAYLVKGAPDAEAPVIQNFSVDSVDISNIHRAVSISAYDNKGITGYILIPGDGCTMCYQPPATPSLTDPRWSTSVPTTVTAAVSFGREKATLFVKDDAGNIASETAFFMVGDAYEPDDEPSQAKEIIVGDAPQHRNSQTNGSVDWAKFSVTQGQTYTVTVTQTEPWYYSVASLALFTANDLVTPIDFFAENYGILAPMSITFTASYSGDYYLRYTGRQHYRIDPKETYTLEVN